MPYYVYILANKRNGTLYVGSTNDLIKRTWQHKQKLQEGFTARYDVDKLVYFEQFEDAANMAQREKRLKEWKRDWKIELIEKLNPEWKDLYEMIIR
ncbi:MAG: GIY-YIG nuclease family protein [Proteobacteria bacterium]|nr:GIY-YIG nuclease family protein [Pseudomonadota bacterium]